MRSGAAIASALVAAILEVAHQQGSTYTTIQSAIDAAVPGTDEVFVRCGRYPENIVMRSGVPVRGEKAACTIIDGRSLGPVVTMTDVVDTKLSEFTIENGLDQLGGGIRITRGSPVIDRNLIRGNSQPAATPIYYGAAGIGVALTTPPAAPVITRNVISDNTGVTTGGVRAQGMGRVEANVIARNTGSFGALYVAYFSGNAQNNTISRNTAGITMYWSPSAKISSNVVVRNSYGVIAWSPQASELKSNDVYGNTVQNYYLMPDQTGINGNVSFDPLFVSEETRNFLGVEPSSLSSLTELASPASSVELSGLVSPSDGRSTGFPRRDIGAKENEGVTRLRVGQFRDSWTWDWGLQSPSDWNLYRGDLKVLRATGVYMQDPAVVPGAEHFYCDFSPPISDSETPPPGETWFYLAVEYGAVRGPLGYDSTRNPRPYGPIHCHYP